MSGHAHATDVSRTPQNNTNRKGDARWSSFISDHGCTVETSFHVHRRRAEGMWQKYFRDAYAASRCYDDRSSPRPNHVVLRRMARGNEEHHHHRRSHGRNRRTGHDLVHYKIHHRNTSVLCLVQNLFPKNKESRKISMNSQFMVVFKNLSRRRCSVRVLAEGIKRPSVWVFFSFHSHHV